MIAIEYDQPLVEQATFLAARRNQRLERELHQSIDPLYRIVDNAQRDEEFRRVFRDWFVRLKLDRLIPDLIAERPLISEGVGKCIVREAPRRKAQSAELFVRSDASSPAPKNRTLVIQLCPQSLVDPTPVLPFMRRELLHVSDMLDDRFVYEPKAIEGLPSTQNLIRDRFRVLWDVYVEGRLTREGKVDGDHTARLQRNFERAFSVRGCAPTPAAFEAMFNLDHTTHAQLLCWARTPDKLLRTNKGDSSYGTTAEPGEPCPLCGFPTYDWYDFTFTAGGRMEAIIRGVNPRWAQRLGACRQCVETYLSMAVEKKCGGSILPVWNRAGL